MTKQILTTYLKFISSHPSFPYMLNTSINVSLQTPIKSTMFPSTLSQKASLK